MPTGRDSDHHVVPGRDRLVRERYPAPELEESRSGSTPYRLHRVAGAGAVRAWAQSPRPTQPQASPALVLKFRC
jgi:hypothetical protein